MTVKNLSNEELISIYNMIEDYIEYLNNELLTEDENER